MKPMVINLSKIVIDYIAEPMNTPSHVDMYTIYTDDSYTRTYEQYKNNKFTTFFKTNECRMLTVKQIKMLRNPLTYFSAIAYIDTHIKKMISIDNSNLKELERVLADNDYVSVVCGFPNSMAVTNYYTGYWQ